MDLKTKNKSRFQINNNNNYKLHLSSLNSNEKYEIWHYRFAHFNIDLVKNKLLMKLSIQPQCSICANSKLKNKLYNKSEHKSSGLFELLHMDLVGPLPESIYGSHYFFTILDDYSRYGWVLFLKNTRDTFQLFYKWFIKIKIKNQFNIRIKSIRIDNGTEFINNNFNQFLSAYGIIHQKTVSYKPQSNGRAERFNGTLITATKAMMNDTKLSNKFREDGVNTANYTHNIIPHKGNKKRVPYEILIKSKVNYNNLHVFGCRVFFYIPKPFRNKFDSNFLPGIFLGYSEYPPAYKILDTFNNKIVLSRTVIFFEYIPGDHFSNNCPSTITNFTNFTNFTPYHQIRGNNSYFINNDYDETSSNEFTLPNSNSHSYNPNQIYNQHNENIYKLSITLI